jgi:hypothetical protein
MLFDAIITALFGWFEVLASNENSQTSIESKREDLKQLKQLEVIVKSQSTVDCLG